jgi:hypothetical protein
MSTDAGTHSSSSAMATASISTSNYGEPIDAALEGLEGPQN